MENPTQLVEEIQDLSELPWASSSMVERLSASGDTTGIPYYHFRWKKKWLADYVTWPTSNEQVAMVLKYASRQNIPVIPRGGGSCYYGSASPTRGGIIIDTKRMDKIVEVNKEEKWIRVQAGAVWEILGRELAKQGLALTVSPQSATASTLAGWLAIGGKVGIGTPKFGSMLDNVYEMTVVRPSGQVENVSGDEMKIFFGTSGIAGVVTEIKMKIRDLPEVVDGAMFGFDELDNAITAVRRLAQRDIRPVYLRLTDLEYEWRVQGGLPYGVTSRFFVMVTYDGDASDVADGVRSARGILEVSGGRDVGRDYYELNWRDRFIAEMKIKLEVPTLSMQNFWIPVENIDPLVRRMYKIANSYRINSCFYLVMGERTMTRFCIFAPSDHRHWMHFMAGKSMLHRMVKWVYKYGGELYTLGLQNTVYLKKFQPKDYEYFQEIRSRWDEKGIMNPDKLTHSNITYSRMNMMFTMNGHLRRLQALLGRAKRILETPVSLREG
ncbi:MAG: FAD-binding oxidoreductase [Candidatus Thorarchaeota archaeon]|nr:MAG: FAD-binding oxidoreductase [Candidatus Thorarchaeota archaeon]